MINISIEKVKENPNNPRKIDKSKFDKLLKSIKEFPEMLQKRPLVVDETYTVLGGNMRLRALQMAGFKEVPVIVAENWTEEQKKQFLIKDNLSFGEWDMDMLQNDFDLKELGDWGMDLPSFEEDAQQAIVELQEEKQELKAYKRVHVLLSFSPEVMPEISQYLQKIKEITGVEYEQGAN